jgi:hypothetical protein
MRLTSAILPAAILAASALPTAAFAAPAAKPSAAEQLAIFKAAGFVKQGKAWKSECGREDPSATYGPAAIETYRDINGDGRPDAVITEGGTYCYGNTGTGYWLLSRQAGGAWKVIMQSQGIADFLKTKGVDGWPDIQVGGPGFCFPVVRWNGTAYVLNRKEYQGKRCR